MVDDVLLRVWILNHRWAVAIANIVAAALFVGGCIGFFWPGLYVASVSLFLAGSLLFLFSALAGALVQFGSSERTSDSTNG